MPPIGLILKVGPYVVILVLLGWIGWLKYDAASGEAERAAAVIKAKDEAAKLSDELIIQQAIAMSVNTTKAADAKEKIRYVTLNPNELACESVCAASERARLGTAGVRALVLGGGDKARSGPADGLSRPAPDR